MSNTIDTVDDATLLAIARDWSFWDRPVPDSVPRRVAVPDALRPSLAVVVQGVRRCGKSTLLRQLMGRYGLDPARCAFLNFEDPRLTGALGWETLEQLVQAFAQRAHQSERLAFFLDEIQNVHGWERWLRGRLDRPGENLFLLSGSNAALLSGELGSVLTGRHRTVELFPFDWQELRLARPGSSFDDFLRLGGFPEPLSVTDGDDLLRQYFLDIVERDVRERLAARSSQPIKQVLQMAWESAGSELSVRRIAAATGLAIDTAGSYLAACEAAYLLVSVPFFAWSERKRASHPRKYYPIDTGLRRAVVRPGSEDRGKALECATLLALRRRFDDVSYWRGASEVDFVVRDGRRVVPLQVTVEGPQARHERALQSFYEEHPQADEAVFVTPETFPELDRL